MECAAILWSFKWPFWVKSLSHLSHFHFLSLLWTVSTCVLTACGELRTLKQISHTVFLLMYSLAISWSFNLSQCGNYRNSLSHSKYGNILILLPSRFYVKSMLVNWEYQKLQFWQFWRNNVEIQPFFCNSEFTWNQILV